MKHATILFHPEKNEDIQDTDIIHITCIFTFYCAVYQTFVKVTIEDT